MKIFTHLRYDFTVNRKLLTLGVVLFMASFCFDLYNYFQIVKILNQWLSPFGLVLLTITVIITLKQSLIKAEHELKKKDLLMQHRNKSYNRFVPIEFFRFLEKEQITDVQLGDNIEHDFTIMVTDIHHFTTLSEEMSPSENFDFVNSYFSRTGPAIKGNHGFIAKYMGDGAMALFGRNSDDALRCAQDIHNVLYVYNQSRQTRNREKVKTGIGIHRGTVRLGVVGSENRMQGDLISDTANMAARIEGLTRIYGAQTVLSESTLKDLKTAKDFEFRRLDQVRLKGKKEPVTIHEMLCRNPDGSTTLKLQTRELYQNAIETYLDQNFAQAAEMMQEITAKNPDDLAAKLYFDSAMFFAINGCPEDWDGITDLDRKS